MTRFLVLLIAAYIIYHLIKRALKGTGGNTYRNSQNNREKEEPRVATVEYPRLKEIAYVFYSASKDQNTCNVCLKLDGKHLLPNHKTLQDIKPPHSNCKNPNGCRCKLVYVMRDENDSERIEALLRKHGGVCDKQIIERNRLG